MYEKHPSPGSSAQCFLNFVFSLDRHDGNKPLFYLPVTTFFSFNPQPTPKFYMTNGSKENCSTRNVDDICFFYSVMDH